MNRKATMQLTISSLILITLGILVLIAITFALTTGFERFKRSTDPYLDTTETSAIKQACSQACENDIKLIFCCEEYETKNQKIKCADPRLELDCALNCNDFICDIPTTMEECESIGGLVIIDEGDGSATCPQSTQLISQIEFGIEGGLCCK